MWFSDDELAELEYQDFEVQQSGADHGGEQVNRRRKKEKKPGRR